MEGGPYLQAFKTLRDNIPQMNQPRTAKTPHVLDHTIEHTLSAVGTIFALYALALVEAERVQVHLPPPVLMTL